MERNVSNNITPSDFIDFYQVSNGDSEELVYFHDGDQAIAFMQAYGEMGWFCVKVRLFFADGIDPRKVYEDVTVKTESDFVEYVPPYHKA